DIATGKCHLLGPPLGRLRLISTGSKAGAIARSLCLSRSIKKHHILAVRQPCRRARPTIHARRFHGVDKVPVGLSVAPLYRLPACFIGDKVGGRLCHCHVGSPETVAVSIRIMSNSTA